MEIKLNQQEIEASIKSFINDQGFPLTGKTVVVELSSTRNPPGYSATVQISDDDGAEQQTATEESPALSSGGDKQAIPFSFDDADD